MQAPGLNYDIDCPALTGAPVNLIEASGREGICALQPIQALIASESPDAIDPAAAIGAPVRCPHLDAPDAPALFLGTISRLTRRFDTRRRIHLFQVTIDTPISRLRHRARLRVHTGLSVPDILRQTLNRAGCKEDMDYQFRLSGTYPAHDFLVQYNETDLAFVERLCRYWGICFFLDSQADESRVLFTDDTFNWDFGRVADVPFVDTGERAGLYEIEEQQQAVPSRFVIRDYSHHAGDLGWTGSADIGAIGDGGEVVEYGANLTSSDEAGMLARVRAEAALSRRHRFIGRAGDDVVKAGTLIRLKDHPLLKDQALLITEVQFDYRQTAFHGGEIERPAYMATFTAVAADRNFRPDPPTTRPRVAGSQPGLILADGQPLAPGAPLSVDPKAAPALDAQGHYAVHLLLGTDDDQGAVVFPKVRMAQPHGGGAYGMHFPLHPGTEVLLTFLDGDPDRPVITGAVQNVRLPTPVTGTNPHHNVLRTAVGNQLVMDDQAGHENIRLSSPGSHSQIRLGAQNGPVTGIGLTTTSTACTIAGMAGIGAATAGGFVNYLHTYNGGGNIYTSAGGLAYLPFILAGLGLAGGAIVAGTTNLISDYLAGTEKGQVTVRGATPPNHAADGPPPATTALAARAADVFEAGLTQCEDALRTLALGLAAALPADRRAGLMTAWDALRGDLEAADDLASALRHRPMADPVAFQDQVAALGTRMTRNRENLAALVQPAADAGPLARHQDDLIRLLGLWIDIHAARTAPDDRRRELNLRLDALARGRRVLLEEPRPDQVLGQPGDSGADDPWVVDETVTLNRASVRDGIAWVETGLAAVETMMLGKQAYDIHVLKTRAKSDWSEARELASNNLPHGTDLAARLYKSLWVSNKNIISYAEQSSVTSAACNSLITSPQVLIAARKRNRAASILDKIDQVPSEPDPVLSLVSAGPLTGHANQGLILNSATTAEVHAARTLRLGVGKTDPTAALAAPLPGGSVLALSATTGRLVVDGNGPQAAVEATVGGGSQSLTFQAGTVVAELAAQGPQEKAQLTLDKVRTNAISTAATGSYAIEAGPKGGAVAEARLDSGNGGEIALTANSTITLNADGSITLKAPDITLEGTVTVRGDLQVRGDVAGTGTIRCDTWMAGDPLV